MKPLLSHPICKATAILSFFILPTCFHSIVFAQTSVSINGYGKASYNAAETGKFMKSWLVAGPVFVSQESVNPDRATQEKIFKENALTSVKVNNGKPVAPLEIMQNTLQWKLISSGEDIVKLDKVFGDNDKNYVYAYALAEIRAEKPGMMRLGVGSDDGIKIWLNGKLVHENWIPREANKDDDIIPLQLVKGSNQILLKVQDMEQGWGFVARLLDEAVLGNELVTVASSGNIEKLNFLLKNGANINFKNSFGITPLIAAKITGREDVAQLLVKNGAKEQTVPSPQNLVDSYYASLKNKEAPGIAILVSKDGKVMYEKGFGYADIKRKKIVTPATKFRIGSVTKQFTAAAILKLQEKNFLSVTDKLSKYIPDFPRGDQVTIHHLLTHTSGIHSYTNKPDFLNRVTKTISEDSLIRYFKNDPYDFNPGENYMYNNSGYILLEYIIGKVSGKTYADYLKQTFFDPLQMKNTGVHYAGIKLENEALGYSGNNGKYEDALNWDMSWAGGAGALYSTLHDLDIWNNALHSGKVLSEPSLKASLTTVVLNNGNKPAMNYGYGIMTAKYRGLDNIHHSGGLHGFVSQLVYYPKQKLSIVMFANNMTPDIPLNPNKIAEAFAWNEMEKQPSSIETMVPVDSLKLYAGRYDFMNGAVMQITLEGNKLFAQLSGQEKFEIFPSSQNEFFWKVVEARIKFIRDDNGVISHGVFRQNGQELNVKKLKEEQIISINPALLDRYTGKYKYINDMVVTVSKENNRLFAQATGQGKLEMFPVSDTQFVLKDINAKIAFKEEGGKVNKLILNLNGTDSELPRME